MNKVNAVIYCNLVTIAIIVCGSLGLLYFNLIPFVNFMILSLGAVVAITIASIVTIFGVLKNIKEAEDNNVSGKTCSEKDDQ